jgi:hypothetical protein
MKVECRDRERILKEQEPTELAALSKHAEECAECREELELWAAMSAAGPLMRKSWESPELWPRIQQSLAEQAQRMGGRTSANWFAHAWEVWAANWKPALAGVALVALTILGLSKVTKDNDIKPPVTVVEPTRGPRILMTEQAVKEIEAREAEYLKSIEKLSELADPQMAQPNTALMASYREKLIVLDAAISELRTNIERNRFNAHLRMELVLLYREKQKTLQEIAEGESNAR